MGSARYYGVGKEGGKRRGGAGTTDEDETNDGSMTIMNKVGRINYLKLSPNYLFFLPRYVTITKKRLLFPKKKFIFLLDLGQPRWPVSFYDL